MKNHAAFQEDLLRVAPRRRDAWVDEVLGVGDLPDDGGDLPRGCVPYLPSPVDAILRVVEGAAITAADVFVDVGSGLGRATMLVHLLTGAAAVGLEVQAALAAQAKKNAAALRLERVWTLHGDAADLVRRMAFGSVFFFYSPFGGERLMRVMDDLRPLAQVRPIRVCFVDMPPPELPWMTRDPLAPGEPASISICRTTLHTELGARIGVRNAATLARLAASCGLG
jgi:SAM-dependent methyltransferase